MVASVLQRIEALGASAAWDKGKGPVGQLTWVRLNFAVVPDAINSRYYLTITTAGMISKKLHMFEILVRQNEAMLLAYILSCVEDRHLAEDIAQETFLVAYRRIETLRNPEAFSPWLRGIARWKLVEALRREPRNVPL